MKRLIKGWWRTGIAGVFILVLGLVLRLYHLTLLPIFADEAIYVWWAQVMRAEATLRFLPLSDGKQPLFMWLVIPFLKIFSDPLFAGRLVSVLCGLGTLVGMIVLSYLLFKSKRASLLAGFIYAISPFTVFFDRMALVDAMLSMFGIWTFVFGIMTARTLRLDLAMFTGFALGGAYLTKSPALFFLLLLPLTWIFGNYKTQTPLKYLKISSQAWSMIINLVKLIFLFLVSISISQIMYNILRLGPEFGMISARNQDYVWPLSHLLTNPMDPFKPYFDRSLEWIRIMGPWPLLLLAAYSLLLTTRKYWKENLVLLAWFIVPIAVQSEFAKVFTARYILFTLPYLIILSSAFVVSKSRLFYKIGLLGVAGFLLLAIRSDYLLLTDPQKVNLPRSERSGYLEEWTAGQGIREVAEYLKAEKLKEPRLKIVVGTEGFFGTLPNGLQIYINNVPDIIVKGVGVIISDVHTSLVESKKAGNRTFLVVNDTRFSGNPATLGLNLIAKYPKAERPDGIYESLLFFEVEEEAIDKSYKKVEKL